MKLRATDFTRYPTMSNQLVTLLAFLLSVCFRANACPEQYSSSIVPETPNDEVRRILENKYPRSILSIGHEPLYVVAAYAVDVRARIERYGRDSIPIDGLGRYGSGMALATIDAEGRILELNLLHSSGDKELDSVFLKTVCAPINYPPFANSLRSKASFLHISLPFTYTNRASGGAGNEQVSPAIGLKKEEPVPAIPQRRAAHVFQIIRVAADIGQFAVISRNEATGQSNKNIIEVKAEGRGNVQVAMIRRMIAILRDVEKGDFIWKSTRLNRDVKLSARPEDTIGLESFLMMEFFQIPTN